MQPRLQRLFRQRLRVSVAVHLQDAAERLEMLSRTRNTPVRSVVKPPQTARCCHTSGRRGSKPTTALYGSGRA